MALCSKSYTVLAVTNYTLEDIVDTEPDSGPTDQVTLIPIITKLYPIPMLLNADSLNFDKTGIGLLGWWNVPWGVVPTCVFDYRHI